MRKILITKLSGQQYNNELAPQVLVCFEIS